MRLRPAKSESATQQMLEKGQEKSSNSATTRPNSPTPCEAPPLKYTAAGALVRDNEYRAGQKGIVPGAATSETRVEIACAQDASSSDDGGGRLEPDEGGGHQEPGSPC